MIKIALLCFLGLWTYSSGQRITTIHLDGVQYFISRMNPYSPELNYFLAYQYCRSLGLQLASFETKEKANSMTTYLRNAGYGNYDFWTSGNRLGTGMFLWMSTGLPFNATFDFFENSADGIQGTYLDPADHNSNTSPQRTARDSSSGSEKGCVILKQPTLKWMPEDCSTVKDFICEQTRCYYYNYGSIPVSSAQGRPIRLMNPESAQLQSTTPIPLIISTYDTKKDKKELPEPSSPPFSVDQDHIADKKFGEYRDSQVRSIESTNNLNDKSSEVSESREGSSDYRQESNENDNLTTVKQDEDYEHDRLLESDQNEDDNLVKISPPIGNGSLPMELHPTPVVDEVEKDTNAERNFSDNDSIEHQSFLSLTDLIRALHPNEKQIPQIDSDYSNAMRVLGETSLATGGAEDSHNQME